MHMKTSIFVNLYQSHNYRTVKRQNIVEYSIRTIKLIQLLYVNM